MGPRGRPASRERASRLGPLGAVAWPTDQAYRGRSFAFFRELEDSTQWRSPRS